MSKLTAWPTDPRDHTWEVWNPTYRVYFWRAVSASGWRSREFEVSGGDIEEVLGWAKAHADDGEAFTVFAVVGVADQLGLVRLAGEDPTRVDDA